MPKATMRPRHRLAILQVALVAWAALVVARLFWLQVVEHGWLSARAEHQQEEIVDVPAHRGTIFGRHLTPLAMSLPVQSIFATPRALADPAAETAALASALDLSPAARGRLGRALASDHTFAWVKRQVTANEAAAVGKLHLKGIYFQPSSRRFYPKGDLAAAVLGFVGTDGQGLAGLEDSYNSLLGGKPGKAVLEVDARRDSYSQIEAPPEEGSNLVLTIDQNIQYIAQQALDTQVKSEHALRGMAVVQNPKTGAILALVNSPTFLPGDYRHTPPSELGDPAVSLAYEPGSVFKLVTISAALQQGLITPDEIIDCLNGAIRVSGVTIHDWHHFDHLTVTQVLQHSSDVGAIQIGLKLGPQAFYHYIRAYGFGQTTGIGLPGESAGLLRPLDRMTTLANAVMSMGQGIAITPLQEVSMISTLADGGVYHAPRIVLGNFRGAAPKHPLRFHPAAGRRVVSPFVANEMKQMMAQVVLGGTGALAQLDGYTAGGKTGTAQMAKPGHRGYSATDYVASFGGFAPLNDPAVTILVVIVAPHGKSYWPPYSTSNEGGWVSAPVFKRIADQVLPYLGVPHDVPAAARPEAVRMPKLDQHVAPQQVFAPEQELSSAGAPLAGADDAGADPDADDGAGSDAAAAIAPQPPTKALSKPKASAKAKPPANPGPAPAKNRGIALYYSGAATSSSSPAIVTPDFTGQTVRAVSEACERLGLQLQLDGNGIARSQSPAPGTRLAPGAAVQVQFTP